jgi:hypothetical protein
VTTPQQETTLPNPDHEDDVMDETAEFAVYPEGDDTEALVPDPSPESTLDPEGAYEDLTDTEAEEGRALGVSIDTSNDMDNG